MQIEHIVVLITSPLQEVAKQVAAAQFEKKLAAYLAWIDEVNR